MSEDKAIQVNVFNTQTILLELEEYRKKKGIFDTLVDQLNKTVNDIQKFSKEAELDIHICTERLQMNAMQKEDRLRTHEMEQKNYELRERLRLSIERNKMELEMVEEECRQKRQIEQLHSRYGIFETVPACVQAVSAVATAHIPAPPPISASIAKSSAPPPPPPPMPKSEKSFNFSDELKDALSTKFKGFHGNE